MTLRQKQSIFTFLVARLIIFANENGYELTFGEAWRTPEQAALNAKKGIGIVNSLHIKKLAIDLNLFKDGKYLSNTENHRILGEWWEKQHKHCRWGGRFNDGNHYEFTESPGRT
jgi:hypothetical protein